MQPIRQLERWLRQHMDREHRLFAMRDLCALFPEMSEAAYNTLLSRAVSSGYLKRICRGVYVSADAPIDGLELFHAAALLRAHEFNYISLETALSDVCVISQVPMNWITLMSSGRTHKVDCGEYGTIEFIHTEQKPGNIKEHLTYDERCHLWRADVSLALRDMQVTQRSTDLIDWNLANELIRPARKHSSQKQKGTRIATPRRRKRASTSRHLTRPQ